MQGYVEVEYDGEWGSICKDKFEDNDNGARAVCRMMGYRDGKYDNLYRQISLAKERNKTAILENAICHGTEATLDQCLHSGWGNATCQKDAMSFDQVIGIRCYQRTGKKLCSKSH